MNAYCYDDSDGVFLGANALFIRFSSLYFFNIVLEHWIRADCFFWSRLFFAPDATRYAFMCWTYSSRRSWEFFKVGLLALIATSRIYRFDDFHLLVPLSRRVWVVGGYASESAVSRWLGGRTLGKSRLCIRRQGCTPYKQILGRRRCHSCTTDYFLLLSALIRPISTR